MIDFANGTIVKLNPSQPDEGVLAMLVTGEQVYRSFKGIRDSVHFTSKRIIAVNVQGLTGKKVDYSSLPYAKIQAWSIETAGRFDRDCELEIYFSGLGKVRLEFAGSVDIKVLGQIIADHVL
ncbi:PH domain-containing protein [Nocardioides sp. CFH 31398]|uniref:PH domain-containing protein n=1 Tax=Nocardioides sp. CFH 31398 TaxID=2919579 RepID=UPI001F070F4D|nr:PH domain-containing protein [Nocardioides sp. CFH 31398]MCH1865437.1 PH domain-containing protein [Nocardioides sp. CFH 31398]